MVLFLDLGFEIYYSDNSSFARKIKGWPIPEILSKLTVKGAAFLNTVTGADVYVANNSSFSPQYKGKIYGKLKKPEGNEYSTNKYEIFYANSPQWVIKFVTK